MRGLCASAAEPGTGHVLRQVLCLLRAKAEGKRLGRPRIAPEVEQRILAARKGGLSVRKTAAKFGVDPATVQRISHPFVEASAA